MKTRADQIREYSDDELACLLDSVQTDGYIVAYSEFDMESMPKRGFTALSASEWFEWLQRPALKYPLFSGGGREKDE